MSFNFNIEGVGKKIERKKINPQIESLEAKEKNPTQLLISRVNNPTIFKQIVDTHLLFLNEVDRHDPNIRNKIEELVRYSIKEVSRETPIKAIPVQNLKEMGFIDQVDPRFHEEAPIANSIPIDLALDNGKFEDEVKKPWARELLVFGDDFFEHLYQSDTPESSDVILMKSIAELHEKGHMIRRYKNSKENTNFFLLGFDLSKAEVTDKIINETKKQNQYIVNEDFKLTPEEYLDRLKGYVFSDCEIIERMSQLKSYFGFSSNECFTEEHLEYARENYIKDTKMNNHMDIFFSAITQETIDEFLKIINNYGV